MAQNEQRAEETTMGMSPERSERSERSEGDIPIVGRIADPEITAKPKRRRFSKSYKLRILKKADQCENGKLGMLLRQEGLYSSTLSHWRKWRSMMEKPKSQLKSSEYRTLKNENSRLKRQVGRLDLKLKRAEGLIELQKKLQELLGQMDDGQKESSL